MKNHDRNSHCNNNLPYPDIKVSAPNNYYANLLMEDYAGRVSELTAINQYMYHSFITNNEDLEGLFETIGIAEMKHLEILAKLIILLGGNPIYQANSNFWNSSYVYYGTSLCDQIEANLNSEYKAIENYQKRINQIQDPYIQVILKRIILDEEAHVIMFKQAINTYCEKSL